MAQLKSTNVNGNLSVNNGLNVTSGGAEVKGNTSIVGTLGITSTDGVTTGGNIASAPFRIHSSDNKGLGIDSNEIQTTVSSGDNILYLNNGAGDVLIGKNVKVTNNGDININSRYLIDDYGIKALKDKSTNNSVYVSVQAPQFLAKQIDTQGDYHTFVEIAAEHNNASAHAESSGSPYIASYKRTNETTGSYQPLYIDASELHLKQNCTLIKNSGTSYSGAAKDYALVKNTYRNTTNDSMYAPLVTGVLTDDNKTITLGIYHEGNDSNAWMEWHYNNDNDPNKNKSLMKMCPPDDTGTAAAIKLYGNVYIDDNALNLASPGTNGLSLEFIDTVSQTNGVVTATKKKIDFQDDPSIQGYYKVNGTQYPVANLQITSEPVFSKLELYSTQDVDGTNKPALLIGAVQSEHLEIAVNEIQAFKSKGGGSSTYDPLYLQALGGDLFVGNDTNNPTAKVTAGSFNARSDARLKENFQPLKTEKSILDLPTYKFDFINGAKNQIGCKAQDLQEICPEIVNEGSDGYLSIQESKIVYLLLEEVKKLRKEIDELKGV